MEAPELLQWMESPDTMDMESLQKLVSLVKQYPFFQSARLLYLKNLSRIRSMYFPDELKKNAIFFPDRRVLFMQLDMGVSAWSRLLHERECINPVKETGTDSFVLIDNFLKENSDEKYPERIEDLLSRPTAQTDDYMQAFITKPDMESSHDENGSQIDYDRQNAMIDSYIAQEREGGISLSEEMAKEAISPVSDTSADEPLIKEDSFLTESLAKIYIKQKKYSKALEIIKKLSLKYPEKNVYFADQIRFLEKIITNIKTE